MVDPKLDPDESRQDAPELEEALDEIGEIERQRKVKTAVIGIAVLLTAAAVVLWVADRTDKLFRPGIDYEAEEQRLIEESNDPVCRAMVEDINEYKQTWRDYEFDFEDEIWGRDEQQLEQLEAIAAEIRSGFQQLEEQIDEAVFRPREHPDHPEVDEQFDTWLGNMENEFRILQEMADKRLRMLRDEEVADRGGEWENPRHLRDEVLMTVDSNFNEFRIWKARGSHPCGPAPEGVDPWQPPEDETIGGAVELEEAE